MGRFSKPRSISTLLGVESRQAVLLHAAEADAAAIEHIARFKMKDATLRESFVPDDM
jgi:hypothetical protein